MAFFKTDDNVELYYQVDGNGDKTVVLIHGWSAHHNFFQKQIEGLSKHYTVVSYDLRGHGQSEISKDGYTIARYAKDLKNLINYLKLDKVNLIGWSMGTHIIFDYVKQFGNDGLESLVLIDMSAKLITDDNYKHGLYSEYSHKDNLDNLVILNDNWSGFADGFVPAIYATNKEVDSELLKWNLEEANKNSTMVMTRMWIDMSAADYRDVLSLIKVPTLVTFGENSALYSRANSEYLAESIKDAECIGFENCGHGLMIEQPELFNKTVSEFIG